MFEMFETFEMRNMRKIRPMGSQSRWPMMIIIAVSLSAWTCGLLAQQEPVFKTKSGQKSFDTGKE